MESNIINILWIDDEYDIWDSLLRKAKRDYNIKLHPYKSKDEGLQAIREKPEYFYSGILLDGCILEAKDSLPGTESVRFSSELIKEVKDIHSSLKICVLTGNPKGSITEDYINLAHNTMGVKYYEKTVDEEKVLQILKDASINKDEYRFEVDFPNIYKLYKFKSIKKSSIDRLIEFNGLINKNSNIKFEAASIRKVIEDFLGYLCDLKFLPSNIEKGIGSWVADATKYLSITNIFDGKNKISKPIIGSQLTTLRYYTNDGTHDDRGSKLGVDDHLTNSKNDLFQMSLIYMLFDVLDFYGSNIEEIINYDRKDVESEDVEKECTIIRIAKKNGWATCTTLDDPKIEITIPDFVIKNDKLEVGQCVLLQVEWDSSEQKYKTNKIIKAYK